MIATLSPTRSTDRSAGSTDPGAGNVVRSQPNYTARRLAAALLGAALLAVVAATVSVALPALLDVGGRPAVASDIDISSSGGRVVRTHVAQPGDTLWSIAGRYRGDVSRDRFVDALISLNGGSMIEVGQAVRLP